MFIYRIWNIQSLNARSAKSPFMPKSARRDQDEQAPHINFFFSLHEIPQDEAIIWSAQVIPLQSFFFFFNYRRRAPVLQSAATKWGKERLVEAADAHSHAVPPLWHHAGFPFARCLAASWWGCGGGRTFPLVGPQWLLNLWQGDSGTVEENGCRWEEDPIQSNSKRKLWLEIHDKKQMRPKKKKHSRH